MASFHHKYRVRIWVAGNVLIVVGMVMRQWYHDSLDQMLVEAVESNNIVAAQEALRWGADRQASTIANKPWWCGDIDMTQGVNCPILNAAASEGNVDMVTTLLDAGADVFGNGIGWGGDEIGTPLELAASRGHVDTVRLLLRRGAGSRPQVLGAALKEAAWGGGHKETVQLLLAAGASPNYVDSGGISVLGRAVQALYSEEVPAQLETIHVLLKAGGTFVPADFKMFDASTQDFKERWQRHDPSTKNLRKFWSEWSKDRQR